MSRGELAFWIAVAVLILAAILTTISGCGPPPKPDIELLPMEERAPIVLEKIKYEIVSKNIGWLQSALIVGAVFSVAAIFLGSKIIKEAAFACLVACLFGMGLVWAGVYYPQWLGLIGLIGGSSVCAYAIYVRRKAFAEVVAGARCLTGDADRQFKFAQAAYQSDATANLVKETKKVIDKKRKSNVL